MYSRSTVKQRISYAMACTHRRQDKTNCLVLSVSAVWTELATRQDSFVLSWPSFQFATVQSQIYRGLLKTWKLKTGSRRDKTHRNWVDTRQNSLVLSPILFTPPTRTTQDRLVLSVSAVWASITNHVKECFVSGFRIQHLGWQKIAWHRQHRRSEGWYMRRTLSTVTITQAGRRS